MSLCIKLTIYRVGPWNECLQQICQILHQNTSDSYLRHWQHTATQQHENQHPLVKEKNWKSEHLKLTSFLWVSLAFFKERSQNTVTMKKFAGFLLYAEPTKQHQDKTILYEFSKEFVGVKEALGVIMVPSWHLTLIAQLLGTAAEQYLPFHAHTVYKERWDRIMVRH